MGVQFQRIAGETIVTISPGAIADRGLTIGALNDHGVVLSITGQGHGRIGDQHIGYAGRIVGVKCRVGDQAVIHGDHIARVAQCVGEVIARRFQTVIEGDASATRKVMAVVGQQCDVDRAVMTGDEIVAEGIDAAEVIDRARFALNGDDARGAHAVGDEPAVLERFDGLGDLGQFMVEDQLGREIGLAVQP